MALSSFERTISKKLSVDFSAVRYAYPDGMLPVISSLERIRRGDVEIDIRLPFHRDTRKLFRQVNWAHFLSPNQFEKSESSHDRHLVTRSFSNAVEQTEAVNDFMDVVIRSMVLPRNLLSGLEWSINEITDNVLNHARSDVGGFVQATTYPKNRNIAFAVADSGQGILSSLREGIPTLRTDLQAMGEAVKAGVTRNPEFGQGNGLAGSLRVTMLTGGSFEITSGRGTLLTTREGTSRFNRSSPEAYSGTVVCGQVNTDTNFSMLEALDFGEGNRYTPTDFIELQYEIEDKNCLALEMRNESTGYGTRHSGFQIRTKILNLLSAEPNFPLVIDWEGVPVISSSFADEVMGKLFLHLGALTFAARIRNVHMEELITALLNKAVAQRLVQSNDDD